MKPTDSNSGLSGAKVWLVLWKASRSIAAHANKSIESLGMCSSDFAVLEALLHKGSMPVNTIGKKVLLTSGSITTAVDRLEKRELVERIDDPDDRRIRLVRLTKEGTKLIKLAFAQHEKDLKSATSSLNEKELVTLVSLLKKLGEGADLSFAQDDLETPKRNPHIK